MDRKTHINFWYIVCAMLLVLLLQSWWAESRRVENIPYSKFQLMLEEGRLESIGVSTTSIRGKLKFPTAQGHEYIETTRIDPDFAKDLANYDVEFEGRIESNWLPQVLSWLLPVALLVGFLAFRHSQNGRKARVGWRFDVGWQEQSKSLC